MTTIKSTTPPSGPATMPPPASSKLRDKGSWRVLDRQRQLGAWAVDEDGNQIPGPGYLKFFLDYPADDAQLAAILKGDRIARAERKMRRAWAGEIVTDLPAVSVPGLLENGSICKANGPDDPYAKPKEEPKSDGGEA